MAPYIVPPYGALGSHVHGTCLEFLSEGEAWLKSQRPATEWDPILDLLSPADQSSQLEGESNTGYNKSKRIAKELVASLTNFRHEGEFRAEHDVELYDAAHMLTRRDRAWFRSAHAHARLRNVLQYAVTLGTGYAWQRWDRNFHGFGRGDIRLTALGPDHVYCIQLPDDHDLQRAYMVIIREELPINLAKRIYWAQNQAFAERLVPDRDAPGWVDRGLKKIQQLIGGSPIGRFFTGNRERTETIACPTVDIFHAYIADDSINESGLPRQMGDEATNWRYQVPSYGDRIPTGFSDEQGNPKYKDASYDDCRLFPLRRLVIFTRSVDFPAYDGTSPFWHGKVPLAKFRFGDWPWEALGQSLIGDIRLMQASMERGMRDVDDSLHARLDPPLLYDDARTSKGFAEAVNPRRAGVRAAADLNAGEIFKLVGADWQYEVPTWVMEWFKSNEARMDYLTGTPDLVAVAKAKQVPSEGTLEKLLEMAGPLVQDMIRSVEEPLLELGEQRKALYLQFDTRERFMDITGEDQYAERFVYVPDAIVPLRSGQSTEDHWATRKVALSKFYFHLEQSGVNEIHRMVTKLFYLQLMGKGFPISWWTFAKIAQIPSFGPAPKGQDGKELNTELEKWIAQKHIERELAGELAQETGGMPPGAGASGNGHAGRPPTNARPPKLQQKDGGTRSIVSTSR